jgi:hypothetical protein
MLSDVKLIRYQFWCTRCAFRLIKSLQMYSGRKSWKSKKNCENCKRAEKTQILRLICFIPIVKPFLTHWSWLRVVPFMERGNGVHGGCDRSTGDAYSCMAPDPTSGVSRGLCKPQFYYGLFHCLKWALILIADFSVCLTRRTDFDSRLFRLPNLDTLILTFDNGAHGGCDRSTGDSYSSMAPDPTSDIFKGPCTPILWFVFPIKIMRWITDRYFCHFISPY